VIDETAPLPTSAALASDSPISWRAAPLPTFEWTAPITADSPIHWRAAPLRTTGSAVVPSHHQPPGAARGIAAATSPPEAASRALAQRSGGTADTKQTWFIFYGVFAALFVVDVIVARLVSK
jgi:hypothetical protein